MTKKQLFIGVTAVLVLIALATVWLLIKRSRSQTVDPSLWQEISMVSDDDIVLGDSNAPLTIIMYYDYNCGFCKTFFKEVYPQLKKEYIQTHKARMVLRLICRLNDQSALEACQTVICINQFGHFDKLHQLLLHKSEIIYSEYFQELKDEYISTNEALANCIINSDYKAIKDKIRQFEKINSKATPTFIIGRKIVIGLRNYDLFKKELEQ